MVTIPWTQVSSLDEALAQLVAAAERLPEDTLPFRLGGDTPAAIDKRSKALARPIPEPICQMYGAIRGFKGFPSTGDKSVFLWDLSEVYWVDTAKDLHVESGPHERWNRSHYLAFGQSEFGDTLTYVVDPPIGSPGSIVMLDHEVQGPDCDAQPPNVVFYADSLAQWLARWTAQGFEEFGFLHGVIADLPEPLRAQMKADHLRLNQGEAMSWAFDPH
jgi:hypothetical protein